MNATLADHVNDSDAMRRRSAWIQLAALASFAALAAPFFMGRVYVADDLGEFHLPVRNFYAEQLVRGEPFDWMPSLYGGFFVAAEGQLGAYHPLHLVLYRWLPLGAAFDIELLASYPCMFAGTFLFLRRLVDRRDAALFGALAFTFCSFNLLHFVHPNAVAVVAHLPWLLFAIDVALATVSRRRRALAGLGISLLTASQLLLGYPQYVWLSLLAESAYVAYHAVTQGVALGTLGGLLLAKVAGILTAGIQLIPTLSALAASTRHAADAVFSNTGSLHPLNLVQLAAPYLFETRVVGQNTHELGLYAGAAPLVLWVWLLARRNHWGHFRPLIRALVVFSGLALLLAAGEFGGLYRLQSLIPLLNRFRFPCRAIVLVQFCIAAGSAVAVALLFERETGRPPAQECRRPLVVVFLVSVALAIVGPLAWPDFVAGAALVWCGPLLVGTAALLVAWAERGARGAAVALVLFTAVDLSLYGLSHSVYRRTVGLHEFVAKIPLPPGRADVRVAVAERRSGPRIGDRMLLAGLDRVDGYAGLEPAKRLDYRQTAAMRLGGVNWVFERATQPGSDERIWTPVQSTAARLRLVTRTVGEDNLLHLDRLGLDQAVVEPPLVLPPASAGTAKVVVDSPGRIIVDCEVPARQLLVTTESFDPGWEALVDDGAGQVVRVNGDFLGCVVERGKHRVVFEFRPASLRMGVLVSAGGLGLIGCMFALALRSGGRAR